MKRSLWAILFSVVLLSSAMFADTIHTTPVTLRRFPSRAHWS